MGILVSLLLGDLIREARPVGQQSICDINYERMSRMDQYI